MPKYKAPKDESHLPRWNIKGVSFQNTHAEVYVRGADEAEALTRGKRAMRHVYSVTKL